MTRAAGALLVVAGGYIVYYWALNLTTDPGETTGAGPARFVESLAAQVNTQVQDLGWLPILLVSGSIIATAAVVAASRHRPPPVAPTALRGARSTPSSCPSCSVDRHGSAPPHRTPARRSPSSGHHDNHGRFSTTLEDDA